MLVYVKKKHSTFCLYFLFLSLKIIFNFEYNIYGFLGVIQWDLLYPTIFNIGVDARACLWILLVVGGTGGQDGWIREVLQCAFFYADDCLVPSTDLVWMQGEFSIITKLFGRVGLQRNSGKKFGML